MALDTLENDLSLFLSFADKETPRINISSVGSSILHLKNKNHTDKTLGFLALVHGNEILGLSIINSLITSILEGEIETSSDIYFGLGNVPAALKNQRFLEEDLNRCFGRTDSKTLESLRAREIEKVMLDKCDFLIDLHQTVSPASFPFFIFQYSNRQCISTIQKWNPGIPVVLQQDQIGENTGLSTDEYLRSRGKFGTALELGQLGTVEHFDLGLKICKNALQRKNKIVDFPILELKGNYKAQNSSYQLDGGWKNLQSFTMGQRLGTCDQGVIKAPASGFMLFPRYRSVLEGQNLFHYCTLLETVHEKKLSENLSVVRP